MTTAKKPKNEVDAPKKLIINHYSNPRVKKIIMGLAGTKDAWRAGNGDFIKWYQDVDGNYVRLFDLTNSDDYDYLTRHFRSLYGTLNQFNEPTKFKKIPKDLHNEAGEKITIGGFADTTAYMLSGDIDSIGDIHDPKVREAVEALAQYIIDELRKICPKSISACFSGGGIYFHVHPKLYEKKFDKNENAEYVWQMLTSCFNTYIKTLEENFFEKHPEHKGLAKLDAINNSKRVFKTLLSVHKKHPYAVVPLDVEDIKISLEDASLPLSNEILNKCESWMLQYDINEFKQMNAILRGFKDQCKISDIETDHTVEILNTKINKQHFPPCIQKILTLKKVGNGATRMKTFCATFLGQAGYENEDAEKYFTAISSQLGGGKSNIFESWFRSMSCPCCETIQKKGEGYPHLYMGELGVCEPDEICKIISHPIEYIKKKSGYIEPENQDIQLPILNGDEQLGILTLFENGYEIKDNDCNVVIPLTRQDKNNISWFENANQRKQLAKKLLLKLNLPGDKADDIIDNLCIAVGKKIDQLKIEAESKRREKRKNKRSKEHKNAQIKEEEKQQLKILVVTPSNINASMEGRNVIVKGRIVAEKRQKALPKKISWECSGCDEGCEKTVDITDKTQFLHRGKKTFNGVLASLSERMWTLFPSVSCKGRSEKKGVDPKWFGTITEYEDYTVLWLNDRLEDQKDLKSSEKKLRVALLGVKPTLGMLVEVEGIVDVDPFSSDLTVIGASIKEKGTTADNFVLDEQTKKDFETYFKDKAIENIVQIAPDMIGYQNVKLSRSLVLHSLLWIYDINGRKIRGVLREILFGDTKTNKSKSIKDNIEKYHFGEWYSAETGSRAGLLYYADTEKGAISWGVLPQNDRGYVGIDALNSLKQEEWSKFKEALEDQKVKVTMAVQGSANIRTRMSLTMNPPKTMSEYLCRCEAIKDTYIFKDKPNITRIDIFISFSKGDVKDDDVIDRKTMECPIPNDIFAKHIQWAWSLTEENININENAIEQIKKETKQIMKEYQIDDIPIVHLATRDVITRISVAMAVLNHSTEDCITVTVRAKDVEMAATFYINMLEKLDLRLYRNLIKSETSVNEEELSGIYSDFEMEHYKILNLIMTGPKGSKELGKLIGVSEKTIKRKYDCLQKYDLIKATTGKGVTLTRRGIFFVKKNLKLANEEKTENMNIRRVRDNVVPVSLMKQRGILSNTLNIVNNNDDKILYELFKQNYDFSKRYIKDSVKDKRAYVKDIENALNKINKKYSSESIDPNFIRDTGTRVSPSTVVDEKITFFKNDGYSEKIEKTMQTKSRHDWSINDLCLALGFADLKSRKALTWLCRFKV